jgi:hypothetical protein
MRKIALLSLSVLLVAPYAQAAPAKSPTQGEIGKFVIVPAGHSSLDAKAPLPVLFSAWRLNTETGAVAFCIYDSGGVVIGKSVTTESLKCVPESSSNNASEGH